MHGMMVAALAATILAGPVSAAAPNAMPTRAGIDAFLKGPGMTPASAAEVTAQCDATLAMAGRLKSGLETARAPVSLADFNVYDDLSHLLGDIGGSSSTISESNPDKAIRTAAEACVQRITDFSNSVSLSRPIYDRLKAIPAAGLDAKTTHVLSRELDSYRRAGVDRDAATRARIEALNKEITATGLAFARNIRDLKGEIVLASADDLAGLPADYIESHKPGPDGKIHLTTDYPDVFPVLDFADSEATRRTVYMTFNQRAFPQNTAVLTSLLARREELAKLLGYPDYAALALENKMARTPARAEAFLTEINAAATPGAMQDYAELLARWRKIEPQATAVQRWNLGYLQRLLRKEKYAVDAAEVRTFFTYDKARGGIFQLVHDLFGADIRPWNTPVWDKSVTAWSLYDGQRLVGHFYLDMHPREGKFSHAASFPIRTGVAGRAVPVGALLTNFPATGPMDHDDVETFLHEFGHLLHGLYSGAQPYALANMGTIEWDFIEAPSQLLEEWVWDYDTLKRFASDPAGRPIPADLVAKMNKARHFGEGLGAKTQIGYSAISLAYYTRPAATIDLDRVWEAEQKRYIPTPYVPGTHGWAAFGHLDGYSAYYYTYLWSKAIALDLFTRFQKAGIRDPQTAAAYRSAVLDPGGAVPAAALVQGFLGRDFTTDAFRKRLEGE